MKHFVLALIGMCPGTGLSGEAAGISQIHNAPGWQSNHAYTAGQQVNSGPGWAGTKFISYQPLTAYRAAANCTTGTIAPSGTGTAIADGTCPWKYLSPFDAGGNVTASIQVRVNQPATADLSVGTQYAATDANQVAKSLTSKNCKTSLPCLTSDNLPGSSLATSPVLQMPPGIVNGAKVEVGTGPHQIDLQLANNGNDIRSGAPNCWFVVFVSDGTDKKQVTAPFEVSTTQDGQQQAFKLHGNWGNVTQIEVVSGQKGNGLTDLWFASISYDLQSYGYYGPSVDARGAKTQGTGPLWDNIGAAMTWVKAKALPPPAQPSMISEAIIKGSTVTTTTLDHLITATPTGSTLTLPAGHFVGTSKIPTPMTIKGAGIGKTVVDATGLMPALSKAILVPQVSGVTISNLSLTGAHVDASMGANAAAVRPDNYDVTLDTVEAYGNDEGFLSNGGNVTIKNSIFHDNGSGNALTHEIYISGGALATLINNKIVAGAGATHALKSRAAKTVVSGGSYTGSNDSTGNIGGSVIDIPDGGNAQISDVTIVVSAGVANTLAVGYAMESAKHGVTGGLTLTNVVVNDLTGKGAVIQAGQPGATLTLSGAAYKGAVAPDLVGWAKIVGQFTQLRDK